MLWVSRMTETTGDLKLNDSPAWCNETLFNSLFKVPKDEKGEEQGPELLKKKKRKVDEGKHVLINKIMETELVHPHILY